MFEAKASCSSNARYKTIVLVTFFVLLVNQFGGIRTAYPIPYWVATAVAVGVLFLLTQPSIKNLRATPKKAIWLMLPLGLFGLYIPLISGLGVQELKACVKYLVITAFIFFAYRSGISSKIFEKIIIAILLIQGGLFLLSFSDLALIELQTSGSRHGLTLAPHGQIWHLAGLSFPYLFYQFLKAGTRWYWYLPLSALAAVIVLLDGSRSGLLILILGGFVATGLALQRAQAWSIPAIRLVLIAIVGIALVATNLMPQPQQSRSIQTLASGIQKMLVSETDLNHIDGTRPLQLDLAIDTIVNEPLTGNGWLGSVTRLNHVIHNMPLQAWSDLGIVGLILYACVFIPAFWYAAIWVRRKTEPDFQMLPVCFVFGYLFAGMFNPISTEMTEWATVAFGLGLLVRQLTHTERQ